MRQIAHLIINLLGRKLLSDSGRPYDWRVNLGAVEAAYILVELDRRLFLGAVKRFYNDGRSSRLRALCAEDLITYILDRGPSLRGKLLGEFELCSEWWITGEDDCWVLEHVFRLLKALAADRQQADRRQANRQHADREQDDPEYLRLIDATFAKINSPFLRRVANWSDVSRGEFLVAIERVKSRVGHRH